MGPRAPLGRRASGAAAAGVLALAQSAAPSVPQRARGVVPAIAALLAVACDPTVSIGARVCFTEPAGDAAALDASTPVAVPWTTGFEDGVCDFAQPEGFCFGTGSGSYSIVTSPVHSGRYAAAFSVSGDGSDSGAQVRCVRQGVFPTASYYGAWYYLPAGAQSSGNWNLWHFQGGPAGQTLHGIWDVSLANASDGELVVAGILWLPQSGNGLDSQPYGGRFVRGTGELSGCHGWRIGRLELQPCLKLAVENVTARGSGPEVVAQSGNTAWLSVGASARARWSATRWAAFFLGPSVALATSRPTFAIDSVGPVYRVPLVGLGASLGCEWIL